MTTFIISWLVVGLITTIAARRRCKKLRIYVCIYSILGGYFSAFYSILCKFDKEQFLDREV